ncbi:uncharacterized protein RB166_015764 [Leptodactylus fuscus]|uniref:uncharacterized protein LOC142216806 n=1 Tax=Leptodactylus fuscus TaxID=238119 RepID=UPI003F4ED138
MDVAEQRRKIRDFTFVKCKKGNQGFERILLQLFGYVSHGKSSFINSVMCVWSNSEYKNCAGAGDDDGRRTTERLSYPLTKNIILVDNRGCSSMNIYESGEIFAQLGNLLPLDKRVNWSEGFELVERIVEAEPHVKATDLIIPIFVYSVKTLPSPDLKEELREIFKVAANLTTIVPIVLLTQKDHQNFAEVKNMFLDIGADTIFALENYTDKNTKRIKEVDEEIIRFLYEVISDAQFRDNYPRDAIQEIIDRKVFVLKYIYTRELMLQEENLERQRDEETIGTDETHGLKEGEEEKVQQKK